MIRLPFHIVLLAVATVIVAHAPAQADDRPAAKKQASKKNEADKKDDEKLKWISLFDGKSLEGWIKTEFGGQGDVTIKDGAVILGVGADMTGIHTKRKLPNINYDVEFNAKRVDGSDFFCGLTFPVGKKPCSMILGGWGGGVVGLSSLDGFDASENDTSSNYDFKNGKWYHVRLRVTETHIQGWIDKKKMFDVNITKRKLSIRIEVQASKPFGFSTWQTTGALKDIRMRALTPAEVAETKKTGAQF
ncbi:MAG: DUF1080 domain-containing protein [Planctomycetota bacterium]|nr:DUF1080 domain-containing protein [Planctomycetota bacterium]